MPKQGIRIHINHKYIDGVYADSTRHNKHKKKRNAWFAEKRNTVEGRIKQNLGTMQRRAKKRNLEYDLDFDWVLELYHKQNGCCSLTGIKFTVERDEKYDKYQIMPFSPSLDRVDNELGYLKTNVRLVCAAINIAINHWGENIFKTIANGYLKTSKEVQNG